MIPESLAPIPNGGLYLMSNCHEITQREELAHVASESRIATDGYLLKCSVRQFRISI